MNKLKNKTRNWSHLLMVLSILLFVACNTKKSKEDKMKNIEENNYIKYEDDVSFLKKYIDIIELSDDSGNGRLAVSAALQGRVMTSSANGNEGRSYGWINRDLFESRDTLAHMNAFGGEERFWLGPEGGQFSIYFKEGEEFIYEAWQTPKLIDLETYDIKSVTAKKAVFTKDALLTNYSGFKFDFAIEREVSMLNTQDMFNEFGIENTNKINVIGYQTINTLTNKGDVDWKKETGLLSIWLLAMYTPSPTVTVVIPYVAGDEEDLGEIVNDDYVGFGKVPSDRLVIKEKVIYFKGDGQLRRKIGISPARSKDVLGSYDPSSQTLTIIKYNKPEGATDYVDSQWKLHDDPYDGHAINAYSDGPSAPGLKPMGPFYEMETSSPALALKVGERGTHIQMTCHIEGERIALNQIAKRILGVSLEEIEKAFN